MDLVDSWARHLRGKRRSPNTVRSYCSDVRHFLEHIGDLDVGDIKAAHVEQFLQAEFARGLTPATVMRRYRSLQQFGRWLERRGHVVDNVIASVAPPRGEQTAPDVLTDRELAAMIGACQARGGRGRHALADDFAECRDTAIVLLLITTGMRASELVGLDIADVDIDSATIQVTGRGGRRRSISILSSPTEAIGAYLEARRTHHFAMSGSALWLGARGPLTYAGLRQMLARRSRAAGIRPSTPHAFRRTFAVGALRHGMPRQQVMATGGWQTDHMLRSGPSAAGRRV